MKNDKGEKIYWVDPSGSVFDAARFGVLKAGWRAATAVDLKPKVK